MRRSSQRLYAALLALGASILVFRTVVLFTDGAMTVLAPWVAALLPVEFALDVVTLAAAVRWGVSGEREHAHLPLRVGAAATILHALRVLIFVMGRVGPWIDFDVRPEERAAHAARWTWDGVYFAAVLSVLGVIGVLVIWRYRRRARTV